MLTFFFRHTIPQGEWKWLNSDDYPYPHIFTLKYTFDFFNYAGIHRPVLLYTLPKQIHLEDIEVVTDEIDVENNRATVSYNLDYFSSQEVVGDIQCSVEIFDALGNSVASTSNSCQSNSVKIENVKFWWPYLIMLDQESQNQTGYGYMYNMVIWIHSLTLGSDVYHQPFGIRKIEWNTTHLLVNQKPFYFKGFGKHEDSDIRGKGVDLPLITR